VVNNAGVLEGGFVLDTPVLSASPTGLEPVGDATTLSTHLRAFASDEELIWWSRCSARATPAPYARSARVQFAT
jgi:hypothetical protein